MDTLITLPIIQKGKKCFLYTTFVYTSYRDIEIRAWHMEDLIFQTQMVDLCSDIYDNNFHSDHPTYALMLMHCSKKGRFTGQVWKVVRHIVHRNECPYQLTSTVKCNICLTQHKSASETTVIHPPCRNNSPLFRNNMVSKTIVQASPAVLMLTGIGVVLFLSAELVTKGNTDSALNSLFPITIYFYKLMN